MPFLADYNPIKKQVKFINTVLINDSHKVVLESDMETTISLFSILHTHAHTKRHPVQIEFYYHFCLFKLGLQCHNKLYLH